MAPSRYIKKEERDKVDKSSGFKCAWCGIFLTERHHIREFYLGGSNEAKNLILLCPNCHTQIHKKDISEDELKSLKKSLDGIINKKIGNIVLNKGDYNILIGSNTYINCENILIFYGNPIIQLKRENNFLLISLKIYNKKGNLIFWMSRNRWWANLNENFEVRDIHKSGKSYLNIRKDSRRIVAIKIENNDLEMNLDFYLGGKKIIFSKNSTNYQGLDIKQCTYKNINGINIGHSSIALC